MVGFCEVVAIFQLLLQISSKLQTHWIDEKKKKKKQKKNVLGHIRAEGVKYCSLYFIFIIDLVR